MPSKKKKYNARFPAGRIKKIMQTDEEIGKVAQAVPVIISRTLELFVEELITKTMQVTMMKNARTLSPHHMKQCILSESRFDFLKDLVKSVPEVANSDEDLGSFSDNSITVQPPRQRSNSRDTALRPVDSTSSPGGSPVDKEMEVGNNSLQNSKPELRMIEEESSDSDELEISENTQDNHAVENLNQESVMSPLCPKKHYDSEDYDT